MTEATEKKEGVKEKAKQKAGQEEAPAAVTLSREQLEALRRKLQKKYH